MAEVYTFFRDGYFGKARVYSGDWEEEDKSQTLEYRVMMSYKTAKLYDEKDIYKRREPILWSNFTNLLKTKCIIKGYNTTFEMKKEGLFTNSWSFMDSLDENKKYTWHVSKLLYHWELRDGQHLVIAEFDRAKWTIRRQGVLTIHQQVPPYLLSCILLTHKILHESIRDD
ncbi:hypothetical protein BJ944DRAFT_272834 [Cunninghamella echinulata]|nr:hypothetical protein BJ944DRAFT_272834 [Cunninghamella echinulata]